MFIFCLVLETKHRTVTKWLSARSPLDANEAVDKALTCFAIASDNETVINVQMVFDRLNFIKLARR